MSETEIAKIASLRKAGLGWQHIADRLGTRYEIVRRAVDQDYADRRRAIVSEWRREQRRASPNPMCAARSIDIPSIVLIERDKALLLERSLTERLCGDPLPGRSALDKKLASAIA